MRLKSCNDQEKKIRRISLFLFHLIAQASCCLSTGSFFYTSCSGVRLMAILVASTYSFQSCSGHPHSHSGLEKLLNGAYVGGVWVIPGVGTHRFHSYSIDKNWLTNPHIVAWQPWKISHAITFLLWNDYYRGRG